MQNYEEVSFGVNLTLTPLTTLFSCFLSFFLSIYSTWSCSPPRVSQWPLLQVPKCWQTTSLTITFTSTVITSSKGQVTLLNWRDKDTPFTRKMGGCLLGDRHQTQPHPNTAPRQTSRWYRCQHCCVLQWWWHLALTGIKPQSPLTSVQHGARP